MRPPERKAWGGRMCVRGANRRCCLQCQLFGLYLSGTQGLAAWACTSFLDSPTVPEDSCYPHSPPFYCSSSPLCVTRRSKAEVYFGFLFFNIKRGSPPQLKENLLLHLDRLPTGYKLYQEYQAVTRIPDTGFLCRAGLTCFKAESSSPIPAPNLSH